MPRHDRSSRHDARDFAYQALPFFACNIKNWGGPGDEAKFCELERNNKLWKLMLLIVAPGTLKIETALSAPGRHELVHIFCCNNSIAILHSDWFHGASDFSHYTHVDVTSIINFRTSTIVRLLVMRMSRKHNGLHHAFDGHCR